MESPSKQIFNMADSTSSQTPTKMNKLDKQWEERLDELQQYKKAHGSMSVPTKLSTYSPLGKWCEYQRARYNEGKLSENRIDRLKKVGFVFEGNVPRSPEKKFPAYDELWKERIRDLKQFIATFGHANVPPKYTDNPELGKWVENQRVAFRRGEIKPHKREALEKAGFVFEVESSPGEKTYRSFSYENRWKMRLEQLKQYRDEHGNCNVPTNYAADPSFGKWVENQKGSYNRSMLSQERTDQLKAIGFNFGKRKGGRMSGQSGKSRFKFIYPENHE